MSSKYRSDDAVVRAVLCGTYKRDVHGLRNSYAELARTGCQILSPHSLDFVSQEHGFQRTIHELRRSFAELERHHLFAIAEADFVWLHAPDGYIGTSAALELGFAFANNTPVFCRDDIDDPAIASFVRQAGSVFDALSGLNATYVDQE